MDSVTAAGHYIASHPYQPFPPGQATAGPIQPSLQEILNERLGVDKDASDPVNSPKHYTGHPSGIEAIQITEHMGFNLGNAMKYIWRCDLKKDAIEDLKKAIWYIEREIKKRTK